MCANVDLDVSIFAFLIDKLEGMPRVTVSLMKSIGNTTIAEGDHDLMDRLRIERKVVPVRIRV